MRLADGRPGRAAHGGADRPADDRARNQRREILHIRHHSLYAPRDFDLSPYFQIVKPTLEAGFDYRTLVWSDAAQRDRCLAGLIEDGLVEPLGDERYALPS